MRFRSNHSNERLVARLLTAVGQPVDCSGIDPGIDRTRHQGHTAWLRRRRFFGHQRHCREHRNARLADPNDVATGAEYFEKRDQVLDKVVKVEPAIVQADVPRVMPVGDIDVVVGQQRLHSPTQQRSEMSGQGRHKEHAGLYLCVIPVEVQQCPERSAMNRNPAHLYKASVDPDAVDAKRRATMAQPRASDEFANSGGRSHQNVSRRRRERLFKHSGCEFGSRA
jgi:hypothetical protein